jgi:hypothetical protein
MPDDGTHDEAVADERAGDDAPDLVGEEVQAGGDAPGAVESSGDVSDLIAAVPLARAALAEITPEASIGEPLGHVVEGEGAVSLWFAASLAGYPGWHWTVTVGRADDDAQPTVLEAELMPGDDALLAPEWVPWSERLAEYQAAQEALAAEAEEVETEGDDEDDDFEDDDESAESDDDDSDFHDLHGGDDVDGVDIDSVDLAYDEDTDVDSELDLASEEAAALADDEDADANDADADEADEADDERADDSAVAAGASDAEVGEAEQA